MGFNTSFSDINNGLFGDDSETNVASSGRTDTATSKDSGQTKWSDSRTSGGLETLIDSGHTTKTGPALDLKTEDARTNTSTTSTSGRTDVTTTSGREDVQQLMITQEGMNNMIRTILEGSQGLAAVTSGERVSGIYNSTVNQMMTDDLITRAAGFVAEKSAPLVTKIGGTTTTTEVGGTTSTTVENLGQARSAVFTGERTETTGPRTQTRDKAPTVTSNTEVVGPRTLDETRVMGPSSNSTSKESDGLLDWIICTELHRQKRLGERQFVVGSRKFAEYDEKIKRGYYVWAVPSVHHLRNRPDSIYSRFLATWFRARATHILKLKGYKVFKHERSVLNPIAYYATHAFCWLLSRTIATEYEFKRSSIYMTQK